MGGGVIFVKEKVLGERHKSFLWDLCDKLEWRPCQQGLPSSIFTEIIFPPLLMWKSQNHGVVKD